MKLKILFILICFTSVFLRCNEPERLPNHLSHYLNADDIQKVEMGNIHGKFILNDTQLGKFRTEFLSSKTVPGLAIKTGSLSIIITLKNGETFVARGNSSSEFLEVSAKIATQNTEELNGSDWLVLDTKEINYNNYRPR